MVNNGLNRGYLIGKLEEIRNKNAQIVEGSGNAADIRNELRIHNLQIDKLIQELTGSNSVKADASAANVVLVVDDNEELRKFIKQALELMEYIVFVAGDGEEALAVLGSAPVLNLVLCDVVLPGKKGPEIVKKIREKYPNIKVIFMSAYVSEDIVSQDVELITASGTNFLKKPFSTRTLLETVQRELDN